MPVAQMIQVLSNTPANAIATIELIKNPSAKYDAAGTAGLINIVSKKEVLHLVGLSGTGNKKTGQFSLGMKQRLSIAIALLHNPSLLILDEPTNGLDPNGILEMREMLKTLNREQGITMVISSHLLPEVEKIATHTGIIHKGRMLFQGTLAELQLQQQSQAITLFSTSNPAEAISVMLANGLMPSMKEQAVLVPVTDPEKIAALSRQLFERGIDVYQIHTMSNDLESIFIDLVKN
ncbi:bacitracin ABC transporter, ATP-binding protein BcrA family protein [Ostertagia ostertagi]